MCGQYITHNKYIYNQVHGTNSIVCPVMGKSERKKTQHYREDYGRLTRGDTKENGVSVKMED